MLQNDKIKFLFLEILILNNFAKPQSLGQYQPIIICIKSEIAVMYNVTTIRNKKHNELLRLKMFHFVN